MTDRVVRTLDRSEHLSAYGVFAEALHAPRGPDENRERIERAHQVGRCLGAFDGDELVGTARSVDVSVAVPGSGCVPASAVTGVGVRPHRTRRGVLRDLMSTQLGAFRERGIPLAGLLASEGAIYGRFGYGVATVERSLRVWRHGTRVREQAPSGGDVELLDTDAALRRLPEIYRSLASARPGMLSRPEQLWAGWEGFYRRSSGVARGVVYHGRDGVEGYAMYCVERDRAGGDGACVLSVDDMHACSDSAFAELWRFLLGVDLVDRVEVSNRPLDEPVEALLDNPQACRTTGMRDHLWLRLVDVRAALAARTYGTDTAVVLSVHDPVLPDNSGTYRVSGAGVERTDRAPQLRAEVDTLAMLYLGTWRPSALAGVGRLEVVDPAAVESADRLFAGAVQPWCGTGF
ncbi:Predicted acetyltransferase [Haloechinothrix alba]|uniref:Predicted acetyltransferase n=1 Tax=Haloechinothrix alba TaxID=664784 RepID=A0A238Z8C3_9PSEU|nr:GNAT family N-acetyltransferase [Haloechinothrix alba]SNR79093.1 Predicted acetyltransferase [Haloechinothrix alba]